MAELAHCPNGHSVPLTGGLTCPFCAAPLFFRCPNGHSVGLSQARCPTCGLAVQPQTDDWPALWPEPPTSSQLTGDRRIQLKRLLRPGERLLWAGEPDPTVRFTKADRFLIPFSVLWAGFSVFWEAGVLSSGGSPFFAVWGLPFVAMGFYITIGRFIWKARRKRQTTYVLTDRRAAILTNDGQLAETPWRGSLRQVSRHRDASHVDVIFDAPMSMRWPMTSQAAMYANTGMDFFIRRTLGVAFFDVADGDALLTAMGQPGF